MYAVVRAGGKQYRVAPGDIVRMEKQAAGENGQIQFDVLAISGNQGEIGPGQNAQVTGQIVDEGRRNKILVFHYKRKKQYKKLQGHRQSYSAVRITEITIDGQRFAAPELPAPKPKKAPKAAAEAGTAEEAAVPKKKAAKGGAKTAKRTASAGSKTAASSKTGKTKAKAKSSSPKKK